MRTFLKIGVLVLMTHGATLAQTYKMLSLRAGAGLSTLSSPGNKSKTGSLSYTDLYSYMGGIGINIPLAGRLSFQPEIAYVRKGADEHDVSSSYVLRTKLYLNYIEVPLLLKAYLARERFRAFIFAGPSIGFALNGRYNAIGVLSTDRLETGGKIVFTAEPTSGASTETLYLDPADYNRIAVGVQGGVAIGMRIGTGLLLLEGRGDLGLIDFAKKYEAKIRTGTIGISYGIPLGTVR